MKDCWRTPGWIRTDRGILRFSLPRHGRRRPASGGGLPAFTLLEVLVVLALLGAVAGLLVLDFVGMPDRWAKPSDYESVHSALEAARVGAQTERAFLSYSVEKGALGVSVGAIEVATFPVKGRVRFTLPPDETGGAAIAVDSVAFSPDGGASPVLISLECDDRVTVFRMEPFSCALSEEKP